MISTHIALSDICISRANWHSHKVLRCQPKTFWLLTYSHCLGTSIFGIPHASDNLQEVLQSHFNFSLGFAVHPCWRITAEPAGVRLDAL